MELEFVIAEEFKNIANFSKNNQISLEDIDIFTKFLLRNAASRLKTDYITLHKLFISNNDEFLEFKETYFAEYQYMYLNSKEFEKMCNLIKIPIKKENAERKNAKMVIKENTKNYTSEDCINLFNSLSLEEKLKFIKEFNKTTITLTPSEISDLLK